MDNSKTGIFINYYSYLIVFKMLEEIAGQHIRHIYSPSLGKIFFKIVRSTI